MPVGVFGQMHGGQLTLQARILSLDGTRCVEGETAGAADQAAVLGDSLARRLLAAGGAKILAELG